jgi:hypothetical protein
MALHYRAQSIASTSAEDATNHENSVQGDFRMSPLCRKDGGFFDRIIESEYVSTREVQPGSACMHEKSTLSPPIFCF